MDTENGSKDEGKPPSPNPEAEHASSESPSLPTKQGKNFQN